MLYRMHDSKPAGMIAIERDEAQAWNEKGFGIFTTVNRFEGPRRIENCTRIRAWAIDLDKGTKAEQIARIERTPLIPSAIVETKSGFHVYWFAERGVPEFYRPIVSRLVEFFDGDKNARDVARVLRVPGFLHLKDPAHPFMISLVYGPHKRRTYTQQQMFNRFPEVAEEKPEPHKPQRVTATGDTFFDQVYNLNQEEALARLSGDASIGGEIFEFRPVSGGKKNILVGGKGTSCWIDSHGKIGSRSGGGPTVIQWLGWYGLHKRESVQIVKRLFPELAHG